MMSPDAIMAGLGYLGRTWGDHGYSVEKVEPKYLLGAVLHIVHLDGSRFTIQVDRWGNIIDGHDDA